MNPRKMKGDCDPPLLRLTDSLKPKYLKFVFYMINLKGKITAKVRKFRLKETKDNEI